MNILNLVLKNITYNKGRFIFTLMGITLGITALVALLALGVGLKHEVEKQASDLGANLVVTPKGWCAYEQISVLTGEQLPEAIPYKDVETIAAIEGITAVPYLTERTAINNNPVPVVGILPQKMKAFKKWEIDKGNHLSSLNERAIVIGKSVADNFKLKIGDIVKIRRNPIPVKGILKETGNKDDLAIFMPLAVTQELYNVQDMVSFIAVKVSQISRIDEYSLKIQEVANVDVVTDKQLLRSVLAIMGTVNLTLQLIATVAVLTAAFGIINTMLTAVYERKKEIGILQAIGAKQRIIFSIFLTESAIYGLTGGVLGIFIGVICSKIFAPLLSQNEFTAFMKTSVVQTSLSPMTIIYILFFSIGISLVSGFYPAYKAAKLNPIEAIRYE